MKMIYLAALLAIATPVHAADADADLAQLFAKSRTLGEVLKNTRERLPADLAADLAERLKGHEHDPFQGRQTATDVYVLQTGADALTIKVGIIENGVLNFEVNHHALRLALDTTAADFEREVTDALPKLSAHWFLPEASAASQAVGHSINAGLASLAWDLRGHLCHKYEFYLKKCQAGGDFKDDILAAAQWQHGGWNKTSALYCFHGHDDLHACLNQNAALHAAQVPAELRSDFDLSVAPKSSTEPATSN